MSGYALGREGAEDSERARLQLLAELHDPFTERQLDAIGVGEGWHCLDVGAAFDLVHARCLLMHLPARILALRRLHAAVRPGGWIAICDVDFTTIELSPTNPSWQRTFSAFCDATIATGWDSRYGARLQSDLEAVELSDIHAESIRRGVPGGSSWATLFAATLERLRDRLRTFGADDRDLDEAQQLLREPLAKFTHATTWRAWERRAER
jgi:hypothetical protein